jgi:DNA (cytosine-5)-methyltransferase 1
MKVLDLFSGIGGFSLGLERAGMKTVAFCEIDNFCQKVLYKHWPDVPVYNDIRALNAEKLQEDGIGPIDVICGGFPCQPFSGAGKKLGRQDNRDLWPEMFRLIKECQPTWIIGENVTGFINMELERTTIDLESENYEVQPLIIPACAVNAPHRRDRVWILAHSESIGRNRRGAQYRECFKSFTKEDAISAKGASDVSKRGIITYSNGERKLDFTYLPSWWEIEPAICGVNNGIPHRMDRIRVLGNAVVPQIPEIIGKVIIESMLEIQRGG